MITVARVARSIRQQFRPSSSKFVPVVITQASQVRYGEARATSLWLPGTTLEEEQSLSRSQRRLLCRIYNRRTPPIIANGPTFLTFNDARRYLLSLEPAAREKALLGNARLVC